MKLRVSDKHVLLRIILTAVFFVIAVVAFTVGVLNIGKKVPGYQLIEGKTDAEALTYNNAVHYKYWFEGSSNKIKGQIRALEEEYTPILSAAYKQLDHQNSYTGHVSIGTINQNLGREVHVSPQLYAVLQDAYGKTLEKDGFNMFAGALYGEWRSILILEDPEDFDPELNEYQAQRIQAIADMVNNLDNFSLEFLPNNGIRFSVSEEYALFCTQYEIASYALDLNVMKDAYMLQWIGDALMEKGYSLGYIFTDEGLVLNTSPRGTLGYDFYVYERQKDGTDGETVYASVDLDGQFAATTITAHGMGSDYGYTIELEDRTLFRSLYFDSSTGEFSNAILSLTVIRPDINIVEAVYQAIQINNLESESAVEKASDYLKGQGIIVSYVPQSVF